MIIRGHLFFWWAGQIIIGLLSVFFLAFGIDTLIYAYRLKNPHEFIMYFFSSNLMILISAVGLLRPLMNIYRRFSSSVDRSGNEKGQT